MSQMSRHVAARRDVHLAHQWWVSHRGGERVLEEFAALFPDAAISTFFLRRETLSPAMKNRDWRVSPLGLLAPRFIDHRKLLPFYPWAARRLMVPDGTRLLLTSDAALIKGVRKPPGCIHVCYCHSPPRYLWDMADEYLTRTGGMGKIGRSVFRSQLARLKAFDLAAAGQVDHFIANSRFVAERIQRIYGRSVEVIMPPVAVERFRRSEKISDYYLIVSELVSYKRVDLAIEACARLGRRLLVVGDGPEAGRLRQLSARSDVTFLGRLSDNQVATMMAECRAFLHPQIEDFGISAVEAQAAGRPVIAFRGGGALETVIEGETGLFFDEQSAESLAETMLKFEASKQSFVAERCQAQALNFESGRFRTELLRYLQSVSSELTGIA
jgi:glycosyltransferase involved in cell wall biosynthesis